MWKESFSKTSSFFQHVWWVWWCLTGESGKGKREKKEGWRRRRKEEKDEEGYIKDNGWKFRPFLWTLKCCSCSTPSIESQCYIVVIDFFESMKNSRKYDVRKDRYKKRDSRSRERRKEIKREVNVRLDS